MIAKLLCILKRKGNPISNLIDSESENVLIYLNLAILTIYLKSE